VAEGAEGWLTHRSFVIALVSLSLTMGTQTLRGSNASSRDTGSGGHGVVRLRAALRGHRQMRTTAAMLCVTMQGYGGA
jgi:hypothetical protein